ncbi:sporulation-specific protein 15-like [Venturia canescens]|uniref:sporulation-specific protein 15-like n=1 Tax=Venturia canescens TaxID=32260 RepID=UPI001C9C9DB2|nr:sporulation-specific protein 15-like [Venturia canescens]
MVAVKFFLVGAVLVTIFVTISLVSHPAGFEYEDEPTATAGGSNDGSESDSFFRVIKKVSRRSLFNLWPKSPVKKKKCVSAVGEKTVATKLDKKKEVIKNLKNEVARQRQLIENLTAEREKFHEIVKDCNTKNDRERQRCNDLEKINGNIDRSLATCIEKTKTQSASIDNLIDENKNLNDVLSKLKNKNHNDIRQLKATVSNINENLTKCNNETESLRDSINRLTTEKSNLNDNLTKCNDLTKSLRDSMDNRTGKNKNLNDSLFELKNKCDNDTRQLKATINNINGSLTKCNNKTESLRDLIGSLTTEKSNLNDNLTRCNDLTKSLRDSMDNRTGKNKNLNDSLIKLKNKCDNDTKQLKATINNINGSLTKCNNKTESLRDLIGSLTTEKSNLNDNLTRCNDLTKSLRDSMDNCTGKNKNLNDSLIKLKNKCDNDTKQLKATINNINGSLTKCNNKTESLRDLIGSLTTEKSNLNDNLTRCNDLTKSLRDSIHNCTGKNKNLNDSLIKLKNKCDNDTRQLKATINNINGSLTKCNNKTESLRDLIGSLTTEKSNLNDNLTRCNDLTKSLRDLMDNCTGKNKNLNDSLIKLKNKCDNDTRQLNKMIYEIKLKQTMCETNRQEWCVVNSNASKPLQMCINNNMKLRDANMMLNQLNTTLNRKLNNLRDNNSRLESFQSAYYDCKNWTHKVRLDDKWKKNTYYEHLHSLYLSWSNSSTGFSQACHKMCNGTGVSTDEVSMDEVAHRIHDCIDNQRQYFTQSKMKYERDISYYREELVKVQNECHHESSVVPAITERTKPIPTCDDDLPALKNMLESCNEDLMSAQEQLELYPAECRIKKNRVQPPNV